MVSIYHLNKAIKHTLVGLSFLALPDFTIILTNANLIEIPKDYSASILVIMNYLCYIMSFVFLSSSIRNFFRMHFNLDKEEPASTVRTQIKTPTQNKKEALDKIVNF